MAEPDNEDHVERKVVYENISTSTTRNNIVGIIIIAVVAFALIAYIVMHLR